MISPNFIPLQETVSEMDTYGPEYSSFPIREISLNIEGSFPGPSASECQRIVPERHLGLGIDSASPRAVVSPSCRKYLDVSSTAANKDSTELQ